MGLDINGFGSRKSYSWGYSGIHQIRAMALAVAGYPESILPENVAKYRDYMKRISPEIVDDKELRRSMTFSSLTNGSDDHLKELNEKYGLVQQPPPWVLYPQFWQLLHFSDCEGYLLPDAMLENVDYSRSYHVGSSTKLLAELEIIKAAINNGMEFSGQEMELFTMLHDLVHDEVTNFYGVIFFS